MKPCPESAGSQCPLLLTALPSSNKESQTTEHTQAQEGRLWDYMDGSSHCRHKPTLRDSTSEPQGSAFLTHPSASNPKNHLVLLRVAAATQESGVAEKGLTPHSKTRVGHRGRCRGREPSQKGEYLRTGQMGPVGPVSGWLTQQHF